MTDTSANNKRIAKNTLLLYIRMFLMMGITLYTSRVVLQMLGVDDFGIYNVVGGIIVLFSFINNAMVASTQRFLNFELGRGNVEEAQKVFAASLNIYLIIVVIFMLLAETLGLWFLNRYINIPPERTVAANWVYQASLVATALNFVRMPYNAAIIAYERMSFYAYTSIIEAALKLGIVFLLYSFADKLIAYAWFVSVVALLILLMYVFFCRRVFFICRHHTFAYDKRRYTALVSFSGWSLFGSVANMGVSGAIGLFVGNFQTAFNPQIVKSYASGEMERFINLILKASKYSYYLLFLIALPCFICCNEILQLWLGEVPLHAVSFCRLLIIFSLIDAIQGPLWMSAQATGKIKHYQLLMSCLILLNLPVTYVVLKLFPIAELGLLIRVSINIITAVVRVVYLKLLFPFPVIRYVKETVGTCIVVSVMSVLFPWLIYQNTDGLSQLCLTISASLVCTLVFIYIIGLSCSERQIVLNIIRRIFNK